MSKASTALGCTTSQKIALDIAHDLVSVGVPIFVAHRDDTDPDGFRRPKAWEQTKPCHDTVDTWQPGDALCAVMGHTCDVIDVDLHKPDAAGSAAGWRNADLWPRSYGQAATPSGGTHDLIAPLRAGSRDKIAPGIDIKGGRADGTGRGYIWIAPTERASKTTGELTEYTWTVEPDFGGIDEVDDASEALAELVTAAIHRGEVDDADVDPVDYATFPAKLQRRIDKYCAGVLERIGTGLLDARTLDRHDVDAKGRGWEKITSDAAYDLGSYLRATWNNLGAAEAHLLFTRSAPTDATWTRRDVEKKWYSQIGRKQVATPPRWVGEAIAKAEAKAALKVAPAAPLTPEQEALAGSTPFTGPLRLAFRFAAEFGGQFLYVHESDKGWHEWDGRRWAPTRSKAASRAMTMTLRRALADSYTDSTLDSDVRLVQSEAGIKRVLDTAATLETFAVVVDEMDPDPYLLNCVNGTLDLRTLTLRAHDPADRITRIARAAWRPDEKASGEWASFLATMLPDPDVRAYVQRTIGISLLGAVREHILPIWTGTGSNGKGTTVETLMHILGDYAAAAEPELLTAKEGSPGAAAGQMDLMGRRLVVVSETDKDRQMAEATMKRLTGGDTIKAKFMGQNWVEFAPSHTVILMTNRLPKITGGDDKAVWRRVRVIPWLVEIEEDDIDVELPERLKLEADDVLAWAVAGYADYVARGNKLEAPKQVQLATSDYRTASDSVGRFLAECCVINREQPDLFKSTTSQLHERFMEWRREDTDAEELSAKALGIELDRRGLRTSPLKKEATGSYRWRRGIGLLPTEEDANPSRAVYAEEPPPF